MTDDLTAKSGSVSSKVTDDDTVDEPPFCMSCLQRLGLTKEIERLRAEKELMQRTLDAGLNTVREQGCTDANRQIRTILKGVRDRHPDNTAVSDDWRTGHYRGWREGLDETLRLLDKEGK